MLDGWSSSLLWPLWHHTGDRNGDLILYVQDDSTAEVNPAPYYLHSRFNIFPSAIIDDGRVLHLCPSAPQG